MRNGVETTIYPLEFLQSEIDNIINDKLFKGKLWKLVNEEFAKKGLDYRALHLLLDNDKKTGSDLNEYELIAIAKSAYSILEREELNPKRYFSDVVIANYKNFVNANNKENFTQIHFKNFKVINDTDSRGEITYKELYDYFNNSLFIYDHDLQKKI